MSSFLPFCFQISDCDSPQETSLEGRKPGCGRRSSELLRFHAIGYCRLCRPPASGSEFLRFHGVAQLQHGGELGNGQFLGDPDMKAHVDIASSAGFFGLDESLAGKT